MNYFFYFLFLINIFNFASGYTQIIHKIDQAINILKDADENTLIIFDIDQTLITTKDPALINQSFIYDQINRFYNQTQTLNYFYKALKSIAYCKQELVENGILKIIKDLQDKNIKTIALTHVCTHYSNIIPYMGTFRFNQLNELGINFNKKFYWKNLILKNLPETNKSYPEFYNGILMTNLISKGEVLVEFLKQLNWAPKKIIFVDDIIENLQSVELYLSNYCYQNYYSIEYIGFHYIRSNLFSLSINSNTLKRQINFLLKKGIWIDTEQF